MANHKSALKRARQNQQRRLKNRSIRSSYRTEIKKYIALITQKNLQEAKDKLSFLHKTIDKAQTKGIIHKANASRKKSRLTLMLNKALAQS